MCRPRLHALALVLLALATPAPAGERETLRAENARLREQVERLEREVAGLRAEAASMPPTAPPRIAEKTTPDGRPVWTTEPMRVDVTGGSRAAHWVWLERNAGTGEATLWVRAEFSGGIYRGVERLVLQVDRRDHALPVVAYDPQRITTGLGQHRLRRDHEVLAAAVAAPVLAALARAGSIGGRLGRTTFTLPTDATAALRALARREPRGRRAGATGDPAAPTAP